MSDEADVLSGVPQGAVLASILCIISDITRGEKGKKKV